MKQKIKIPDEIVKKVATEMVKELKSDWHNVMPKNTDIPSTKQLISKVMAEINNCPYVRQKLSHGIEDMILESFHSDILHYYYAKLSDIKSIETITLEQQLVQQVQDMGYEVKKKTNTKVRGVIK